MILSTFDQLDNLCDFIIANKLPIEVPLFMDTGEMMTATKFLSNLGSGGVETVKYQNTDVDVDCVNWRGINFYIFDVNDLRGWLQNCASHTTYKI